MSANALPNSINWHNTTLAFNGNLGFDKGGQTKSDFRIKLDNFYSLFCIRIFRITFNALLWDHFGISISSIGIL